MDVTSLYTNIPQKEGTEIICKAYELFHNNDPPIATHYQREMLGLIHLSSIAMETIISKPMGLQRA